MSWKLKVIKKVKNSKNSILIGGLPGVGNVGKLAVDFLIDDLKAEKIYEVFSPKTHNCVFVNEDNLVEMPFISIYYKKLKNKDLFLLAGDIHPMDGSSCYDFCKEMLNFCEINNCKEIITLGGVGTKDIPKKPKVYYTGNNKKIINKYTNRKGLTPLTGQIVGVSGLLIGMAVDSKIDGVGILAETFAQPGYIGTQGANEILLTLNNKLDLKLNLNRLKKEMKEIEISNNDIDEKNIDLSDMEDVDDEIEYTNIPSEDDDLNYIG